MLFLLVSGPRHASPFLRESVVVWGLAGLFRIFTRAFIYWDITPDGLCERHLSSVQTIPWSEIISVAPWPDSRRNQDTLAIDYARPAPLSATGQVLVNPSHLDEFLAALREHAPQARFTVPGTGFAAPVL
ncbi:MAG: hypothetical protein WA414_01570 [Acidobacteriaceae bacterium]